MDANDVRRQAAIVDEARNLLQAAQAGEIQSLALVAVTNAGGVVMRLHGAERSGFALIGALTMMIEDTSESMRVAASAAISIPTNPAEVN